jgi:hypothetical protein
LLTILLVVVIFSNFPPLLLVLCLASLLCIDLFIELLGGLSELLPLLLVLLLAVYVIIAGFGLLLVLLLWYL